MTRIIGLVILLGLVAPAVFAQDASAGELAALRQALEEALRENIALRADLEAARAEIDRLRGGALRPVALTPLAAPSAARTHTVVEGETLGGISTKYYGNPNGFQRIFEANRGIVADVNKIYPGQKLVIP